MSNYVFSEEYAAQNLMGPNVLPMFEELCAGQLPVGTDSRICDLGCGAGLSSLAIACAVPGTVYAVDSWNDPEENGRRFSEFGCADRIVAVQADAPDLPFPERYFDAMVCLDSYNYFGREEGVIDREASYVKAGGKIFLGISGVRREPTNADMEVFGLSWSPEQMDYIRTPGYWETLLGKSHNVRIDRIWEMSCHERCWRDWIACDNEYAQGDRAACKAGAIELMCTIGIELTVIG